MIKNAEPISMAEATEFVDKKDEQGAKVLAFVKKFIEINPKKAKEMKEKLLEMNSVKLNKQNIAKIIDLLPENAEEVNKIFTDVNLDEDETKKIIDIVKEYK